MVLKDILVLLDSSDASERRLSVACELARRHDAHLRGLHVIDLAGTGSLLFADDVAAIRLADQLRAQALADAQKLEEKFRAHMRAEGLPYEWTLDEGIAPEVVTQYARIADLAILGQNNPDNPSVTAGGVILEQVLFGSGRPVLMVPYAGTFEPVGHKILVGWTPTREAARAVNDMLPLMVPGAEVSIFSIVPREDMIERPGALTGAVAEHLTRHGAKTTGHEIVSAEISPADLMLNTASDEGSDLLVIGAYGHSRLRELVVGGVTRTLLENATIPVLMSH